MKKANNILGIISFIALMPLTWIAYKIKDAIDKKEKENPVIYSGGEIKTTYPDGYVDSTDGFNKWSGNIYKQLNKN